MGSLGTDFKFMYLEQGLVPYMDAYVHMLALLSSVRADLMKLEPSITLSPLNYATLSPQFILPLTSVARFENDDCSRLLVVKDVGRAQGARSENPTSIAYPPVLSETHVK